MNSLSQATFAFEQRNQVNVYYTHDKETILFELLDVADILEEPVGEIRRFLQDHEYVKAENTVPAPLGERVITVPCITEGGVFHACINHEGEFYDVRVRQKAGRFMHWVTHRVVPAVIRMA